MLIGCNPDHRDEFAGAAGRLDVVRVFTQTQNWPDSKWDAARQAASEGRAVRASLKPSGTWAQAATGRDDSRIAGVVAGLASLGVPVALVVNHEPENDSQSAADFRAMQAHVLPMISGSVSSAVCLMGSTFSNTTNYTQWIPTVAFDILAADIYDWGAANQSPVDGWAKPNHQGVDFTKVSNFSRFTDAAAQLGKPAELWEYGCARWQDDTGGRAVAQRLKKVTAFVDWAEASGLGAVCYFELNRGESGAIINWRLSPQEAEAARKLASLGGVVVPEPEDPCAEVKVELAAALAELDACQGETGVLQDALNGSQAKVAELEAKIAGAVAALT